MTEETNEKKELLNSSTSSSPSSSSSASSTSLLTSDQMDLTWKQLSLHIHSGFQLATAAGPLAEEEVQVCCFCLFVVSLVDDVYIILTRYICVYVYYYLLILSI
jgi:translation elongation factor EF-G